ncbi:MAG TPA: SDR family NAD(P)-dependent oxidoreductase [Ramlibacter sp.]|jgi:NAD(P)-dependent dehydrogenase (short-subunit alcohol dehydrogenase family)|nr:SDR family NAD(P)-dependent oxidoreductase [Ramlibacter sp.]
MTQRHLTILTGASRGMGLAMAQQLLQRGHDLLCISRKTNDALAAQAAQAGRQCEQWPQDLARGDTAAAKLETWLQAQDSGTLASVTLINNAGMIPQIAPIDGVSPAQLAEAMRVDLEAPMLLTGAFLRATNGWPVTKKILNISSGLGRQPMASQAVYCAAKAGMDHFSRCVALEQAALPHGARVCSVAPGVIDTDMQVQMRSADSARFPDKDKFVGMKENGALSSPDQAAARLLAFLERPDFGSNVVTDARG